MPPDDALMGLRMWRVVPNVLKVDSFVLRTQYVNLRRILKSVTTPSVSHGRGGGIARGYRGTSLIRNTPLLEFYCRTEPRVLWWS
jgi:hypothetical protein